MNKNLLLPALLCLLGSSSTPAQTVGGYWETTLDVEPCHSDYTAQPLAAVGDFNGDGVEDLAVGHRDASSSPATETVAILSGADGTRLSTILGPTASGFGHAVDGAGDVDGDGVPDLIIGAPTDGLGDGAAYLVSGATGATLFSFHGSTTAQFGRAVAGLGDVDGDTIPDVAVGTPFRPVGLSGGYGGVDIYSGLNGAKLLTINTTSIPNWTGFWFGWSIAGADLDGDGLAEILVGAPRGGDVWHGDLGRVDAFDMSGSLLWTQFPGDGSYFGNDIAVTEDIDGDGIKEVVVGNPFGNRVTVHSGASGTRVKTIIGPAFPIWGASGFGIGVAADRDLDGDGTADIVVGAPMVGLAEQGATYVVSGTSWTVIQETHGAIELGYYGNHVAALAGAPHGALATVALGTGSGASAVSIERFMPALRADSPTLSASLGGRVDFDINFPDSEAGQARILLASLAGPGTTVANGTRIPLEMDALFMMLATSHAPPQMLGAYGTLDANGDSTAALSGGPGGVFMNYIGSTIRFAAVAYAPPSGARLSSVAVPIEIVP